MRPPIVIANRAELLESISMHISKYGNYVNLNHLDVSNVTDMSLLFLQESDFNGDISQWDVSRVIDMEGMFCNSQFNGDLSRWNVSNVTNMINMFSGAQFDGDISEWLLHPDLECYFVFDEYHPSPLGIMNGLSQGRAWAPPLNNPRMQEQFQQLRQVTQSLGMTLSQEATFLYQELYHRAAFLTLSASQLEVVDLSPEEHTLFSEAPR